MLAAALLAVALGAVAWFTFARGPDRPSHFGRSHARWIRRATLAFAAPALIGLTALGRLDALVVVPGEFGEIARRLPRTDPVALLPGLGLGLLIGLAVVLVRIGWARWRDQPVPRYIAAAAPLAARNRGELLPAAATALVAGVTEELAFRLFIPLVATLVSGSAWFGFAFATLLFGALHRYQSWPGRIGVTALGTALIAVWLMTGALWLAMLIHAAIDLMALVVRPWLAAERRPRI